MFIKVVSPSEELCLAAERRLAELSIVFGAKGRESLSFIASDTVWMQPVTGDAHSYGIIALSDDVLSALCCWTLVGKRERMQLTPLLLG